MDSKIKARRLLLKILKQRQLQSPRDWTLRKVAQKISVSHTYLSLIFTGKKPLSKDIALALLQVLQPAQLEANAIVQCFEEGERVSQAEPLIDPIEEFELIPETAEWLLGKWYRLAILDFLTTEEVDKGPAQIANRLGLTESEVEQSLRYFQKEGLAKLSPTGNWEKTFENIRFPAKRSRETIRNFHRAQLKRIDQILTTEVTPAEYSRRLVIGISVAVNTDKLQEVKSELEAALHQAARSLSTGPCQEVYQLNLQLVPQTKLLKKKQDRL